MNVTPNPGRVSNADVIPKAATSIVVQGYPWLEDGNIILQTGHIQFRVHKSVLSIHSSVFADMFSLPVPNAAAPEDSQGTVVVQLYDKPVQLEVALRSMYHLQ